MKEKSALNIQIGERIKQSREISNYTQERFAEMVGVSPQYISDLERGNVGVSIATFKRICEVLNASSDYILLGKETNNDISPVLNKLRYLPENKFYIMQELINKILEIANCD